MVSYIQNAARIVGGLEAEPYSWPAQILIENRITGKYQVSGKIVNIDKSFTCGGTLINSVTVLTAAHCITTEFQYLFNGVFHQIKVDNPFDPNQFTLYAGAFDLERLGSFPTQKLSVKKVIRVSYSNLIKIDFSLIF